MYKQAYNFLVCIHMLWHVCMAITGSPWVSDLTCHLTLYRRLPDPQIQELTCLHLSSRGRNPKVSDACFQPSLGASSGLANSDPQAYVLNTSHTTLCPQTPST